MHIFAPDTCQQQKFVNDVVQLIDAFHAVSEQALRVFIKANGAVSQQFKEAKRRRKWIFQVMRDGMGKSLKFTILFLKLLILILEHHAHFFQAQMRPDTGENLLDLKWLRNVIYRTHRKRGYLVKNFVQCADENYWHIF